MIHDWCALWVGLLSSMVMEHARQRANFRNSYLGGLYLLNETMVAMLCYHTK